MSTSLFAFGLERALIVWLLGPLTSDMIKSGDLRVELLTHLNRIHIGSRVVIVVVLRITNSSSDHMWIHMRVSVLEISCPSRPSVTCLLHHTHTCSSHLRLLRNPPARFPLNMADAPTPASLRVQASLRVLADRTLFRSIEAFSPGIPFFALLVKRQLRCAQEQLAALAPTSTLDLNAFTLFGTPVVGPPLEDVELWQNAIRTGDKRALEALHLLLLAPMTDVLFEERLRRVLKGMFGFALTHAMETRETTLLDWIHANDVFPFDRPDHAMLYKLGLRGDVEPLRWLYEHGYFIDFPVANGAATCGNIDVLYFIQSVGPESARVDGIAIACAAANGHLNVLKFLIQQQTEWNLPQGWITDGLSRAIEAGHLHVVQCLHENGYMCEESAIDMAAANGHLDVVMYLREKRSG